MSMTLTYNSTSVVLPSPIYAKKPSLTPERWQNANECGDGTVKAYDHDITVYWIELGFRVTYAKLVELRTFVKNTIMFRKLPFTLTPDATFDCGAGAGDAVSGVYLWQDTLPEPYERPGLFECKLLIRTYATGTGDPAEPPS